MTLRPVCAEVFPTEVETSAELEIEKSVMRTLISKLESEERDWKALETELANQQTIASTTRQSWTEMEDAFAADSETLQLKKSLEDAQADSHQRLAIQ
eukprot:scaffold334661_cov45-Prasinocladus_malaysianus.AAC.1